MHNILVGEPRDNSTVERSRRSRCSENNEAGLEEIGLGLWTGVF